MNKQLTINLLDDTLTQGRIYKHDVIVGTEYWMYSKTAILDRAALYKYFSKEMSKSYTVDRMSTDLYVRLMQTSIVIHISKNMPDLSDIALTCELQNDSLTWKPLLQLACVNCMKFQQFYIGVNKLYVPGVLVVLRSIAHDGKMELHIYFDEKDILEYNDHVISRFVR